MIFELVGAILKTFDFLNEWRMLTLHCRILLCLRLLSIPVQCYSVTLAIPVQCYSVTLANIGIPISINKGIGFLAGDHECG